MKCALLFCALASAWMTTSAGAATVLGFERINATYPSTSYASILGYYGGGISSQGTSGPNFGITFATNAVAVCLNAPGGTCSNASRGGLSPTSGEGGLASDSGGSTYLDFGSAYTGAVAFRYQVLQSMVATIQAFSGPGGTGSPLTAPLALFNTNPAGCPVYNAPLCGLGPGGLGFVTGARSIVFGGVPRTFVFDDLTFGAGNDPLSPPAVPAPAAWTLLLAGLALIAGLPRRRAAVGIPVRRP